ncbi:MULTISPECIES: VF530 family protein [Gibbsiella]|uniref:VF530 family DNA-binding protein n=1 Tax=Gibbsiella dentisursi TaxID=796890 RepID=A0ABP7KQ06_9GAMM|nr:VF530 family protein [Gibbsiella quercinecans]
MTTFPSKDPLHGITLEQLLNALVAEYGWPGLAERIRINCFRSDPSIKSSLKFLRRTPWARKQVEELYIRTVSDNPWLRGRD